MSHAVSFWVSFKLFGHWWFPNALPRTFVTVEMNKKRKKRQSSEVRKVRKKCLKFCISLNNIYHIYLTILRWIVLNKKKNRRSISKKIQTGKNLIDLWLWNSILTSKFFHSKFVVWSRLLLSRSVIKLFLDDTNLPVYKSHYKAIPYYGVFAGSLESANSSILAVRNLFKDFGGEKIRILW